jgi:hypothetical protein
LLVGASESGLVGENEGERASREEKARHALGTESIKYPEKPLPIPKTYNIQTAPQRNLTDMDF